MSNPETQEQRFVGDSRYIHWLLHVSGISRYEISKHVGISESTLSRIVNGHTSIEQMRFGYAHILTEYAKRCQKDRKKIGDC